MQLLNDNILVRFIDDKDNFVHGSLELVRPKTWEAEENENGTMYNRQLDLRQTSPQIAEIVVENAGFSFAKKEDRVFVHYLSHENSQEVEHEGETLRSINVGAVFFKLLQDNSFEMTEDVYLGESIFGEEEKTLSGIILTPFGGERAKMVVKITHTPAHSPYVSVGDVVYTIDDNQYELEVFGKKYVKLNTWHIVAKKGSQ